MAGEGPQRKIRVLHLILMVGETNSQYNEHCLPLIGVQDLSICTYFVPQLTPPREIALFAGNGSLRGFFRALRAALDTKEYDVVHAHSPHTALLLVLALLAWRRFVGLRSSMAYTVHASFRNYKLRNKVMMVMALPAFKRVVFCGHASYESLPRIWRWLVRDRWRVVQNGADIQRVDRVLAAGSDARREESFTVISVGRLENAKDPVTVLDAFGKVAHEDSRLVFVGKGGLESTLGERAVELGLEHRVQIAGLIPRDEVFARCASADVFVSASYGEGLPVAVMEAMASRCPVILSDIPPHREVADGADFIPLIAPGDVAGFAREIQRYRDMSPEERLEIGRRCRDHVTARFALPIMHAGIEAVYRELPRLADTTTRSP